MQQFIWCLGCFVCQIVLWRWSPVISNKTQVCFQWKIQSLKSRKVGMPNMKVDTMKWFIHYEFVLLKQSMSFMNWLRYTISLEHPPYFQDFTLYNFLVLPELQMVLLWSPRHSEHWLNTERTFGKLYPPRFQVQQERCNAHIKSII